jgi:hypothetical protein
VKYARHFVIFVRQDVTKRKIDEIRRDPIAVDEKLISSRNRVDSWTDKRGLRVARPIERHGYNEKRPR